MTKENQNKKSKIPYFFVAFFAVFITADIILIYVAHTSWRGTVTENSYEKGRKYNKVLLNNKIVEDLGWNAKVNYESINSKKANVLFNLKDNKSKIINDAVVKVKFVRPTQTGFDFDSELIFNSQSNNYQNIIDFPLIGLWKMEVQAFRAKETFQYVKRIVID